MKIISRDEVIAEKVARRKELNLEYHASGDCIHLGKISRGCKTCFTRNPYNFYAIYTGCECNVACGYCYYDKNRNDRAWNSEQSINNNLSKFYELTLDPKCDLKTITYNSQGETLMYPDVIKKASDILKAWQEKNNRKVYSHLYTNGTLADKKMLEFLKECEVSELRFHISASNFNKKVFFSMKDAVDMGFIVTVEEPSLPENKEPLMAYLEVLDKIGINHLDMVECQVTRDNKSYLESKYPNGRIYRDYLWHFYDEGMVYDIMEEVINKKYSFSVIDCNSRVECCRATNQVTLIPEIHDINMMNGACLNDNIEENRRIDISSLIGVLNA